MKIEGQPLQLNENWIIKFLISPELKAYRHIILVVFISLALYNMDPRFVEPFGTISKFVAFILFFTLFYTNMYIFVPHFLFQNKYVKYGLAVSALIGLYALIYIIGWQYLTPFLRPDQKAEIFSIIPFSFVILILISASSAVKLFQKSIQDNIHIHELLRSKTISELEQLKNQINPHFLFNMLNNANVLTKKDPHKASEVLMKLSDLLRYQLYDSAREKVFLTSDIRFLEDFLNLEKVRRDSFEFLISKEGNLNNVQVPPLLFITFVENAVKHNNDADNLSYVHVFFEIHNNVLTFKCINSKPTLKAINNANGGLGLANIRRRLELLFPNSHSLDIEDRQNTYAVTLKLNT
jgi:sensor histidine kinase YesM